MDFAAIQAFQPTLAVSRTAQEIVAPWAGWLGWLTNSILVAAIVVGIIMFLARKATKNMQLVPGKAQNFFEFIVEFLYGQVEGIVGKKVAPRAFPLLATIFIFVLTANWFGLLPGVGTMGWATGDPHGAHGHAGEVSSMVQYAGDPNPAPTPGVEGDVEAGDHDHNHDGQTDKKDAYEGHGVKTGPLTVDHVDVPLFRPATADLNMTLGIAVCFMLVWIWLTFTEIGVLGFIKHVFAPKGGLKGALAAALLPIFMFVGVIELISIAFRPVSLSLRLYGNVFAGESLLHEMMHMGENWGAVGSFVSSVVFPLPFYFLELLVGVLQAMVFALLCAVYIQLSTTHEEHDEAH